MVNKIYYPPSPYFWFHRQSIMLQHTFNCSIVSYYGYLRIKQINFIESRFRTFAMGMQVCKNPFQAICFPEQRFAGLPFRKSYLVAPFLEYNFYISSQWESLSLIFSRHELVAQANYLLKCKHTMKVQKVYKI